jgi:SPASM domain peptide maturase of grasp-with-spasm system
MKKKFKLYSNCLPVKGKNNSIICDLQRNDYEFIPNDLFNILKKFDGKKSVDEIKFIFENLYDDIIDEYFNFLFEKEFIFFTNTPKYFPKMDLSFHYPFEVSNAIIEIGVSSDYNIFKTLIKLDNINCKFIEIRFNNSILISKIEDILDFVSSSKMIISSISFIVPFSDNLKEDFVQKLITNYPRLSSLIIYNSPVEYYIKPDKNSGALVVYTTKNIGNNKHCGKINPHNFTSNIQMYTESVNHNSCLHKKISIDAEGNIKNCPAMSQSYGNIKDTTLEEALHQKDFKQYWNITKDEIEVCKDCEFRYICTDCRAYTERTHINKDQLDVSKPLKCGYNPYTGEWEEWSTNPLKEKAITYYGM